MVTVANVDYGWIYSTADVNKMWDIFLWLPSELSLQVQVTVEDCFRLHLHEL